MQPIRQFCRRATTSKPFELLIAVIILINAALIGVSAYTTDDTAIENIQRIILVIFTVELLMRFIARDSLRSFFTNGWNLFDIVLIALGYMPVSLVAGSHQLLIFRTLRVVRVLRILRINDEVKIIAAVLTKSMRSLVYNGIFFFAFLFLFANIGYILFKLPDPATLTPEKQVMYQKFTETNPNAWACTDPYGSLDESMFTLFRVMTGDDWTTIRYSLQQASAHKLITPSATVVTLYHVLWFSLSAFLLLNLLVGAVVNNYQTIMEEMKNKAESAKAKAAEIK